MNNYKCTYITQIIIGRGEILEAATAFKVTVGGTDTAFYTKPVVPMETG